jgi:maltose O-acetyltransferase
MVSNSEKENMLTGKLYRANDPQLIRERINARRLTRQYNLSTETEMKKRNFILKELLGKLSTGVYIEPPFRCDYGYNIFLGEMVYMNFGCVFLDVNPIRIGDQTMLGPYVQIYTATHPLDADQRSEGPELGKPITIGKKCWIGGGTIINPGIMIGDNTTIGAGSVVTKDIPSNVFAAGNPCKVIKNL